MNQATLQNVVAAAKAKAPHFASKIDATAKAMANGELVVTLLSVGALVTGNGSYRVRHGRCECKAAEFGRVCRHRLALRLAEMMDSPIVSIDTIGDLKDLSRADIIRDIRTTFAAKFPGFYLADTVQKLVGPYTLEMLGVANLQYILTAIA